MPQVVIDATFVNKAAKLLKKHPGRVERVQRTLGLLAVDPLDPVVRTKKYDKQLDIWQSYIEQGTPSARRIWWHPGPIRLAEPRRSLPTGERHPTRRTERVSW